MATIFVDKNGVQVVTPASERAERAKMLMPAEEFAPSPDDDGNAVIDMLATKAPSPLGPTSH